MKKEKIFEMLGDILVLLLMIMFGVYCIACVVACGGSPVVGIILTGILVIGSIIVVVINATIG